MRFFSLLHLSDRSASVNSKAIGRRSRQALYIDNAINLSKSLRAADLRHSVLTNDVAAVEARVQATGNTAAFDLVEDRFDGHVPAHLAFHAAHHKIAAMRHLSRCAEPYVGLLDLDMTYNGSDAATLLRGHAQAGMPLWYDISDQVRPAYGLGRIRGDMQSIDPAVAEARWPGGEFIAGPPSFFGEIAARIDACWDRYIATSPGLHHQGDEMLLAVALEAMRRDGVPMADAGRGDIVGRYWSGRVRHVQRSAADHLRDCAFLHLPQDKLFLAQCARLPVSARRHEAVRRRYGWYLRYRLPFKAIHAVT